jgi:uncharacterized protein
MKKILLVLSASVLLVVSTQAQVLLSGGLTYSQNFDSLSNSPAGTTYPMAMLPSWYASRSYTAGTTSTFGPYDYTTYRVGDGSSNGGWIYSFGAIGATDRALGSLASGTPKTNAFGVLIKNDTASDVDNVLVSYTGEQWRNGGNTNAQVLAFSYKSFSVASPFSSPLDTAPAGANSWVGVSALNFTTPTTGATAGAIDGNAAANQVAFSSVLLSGVTVAAGDSIFLRWVDIDDSGNDHAFGVDNFSVSFSPVPEPATLAFAALGGLGLVLIRRRR